MPPGRFPRLALAPRLAPVTALAALLAAASSGPARAERITFEEEREPFPGVRILERHTADPSWRIHAAFVSLCTDGVHVDARSSQATRITSAAWGSAMGAQLAVNGDFYRTDRTAPTVYGDAVGVGLRWPAARSGLGAEFEDDWYYRRYGWIAFGDGWVELQHSKYVVDRAEELGVSLGLSPAALTRDIPDGTIALVSGFPELVVEGRVMTEFPDRGDMADRHPRTAMGLTADRRTFILAVVDGRSTRSVGMNGRELARLMGDLGAHVAFNLDGGGSSQMWIQGQGTINTPSDGSPRPVANHWGVFAGTGHSRGAAPGSCFTPGGCYPAALPEAVGSRFADLPDDDDRALAAAQAVDRALVAACGEGAAGPMFCPACPMTRRDALAMVVRAAGLDTSAPPDRASFGDVPPDDAAYPEIEAAAAAGLTTGCGDGAFCPDDPVRGSELAAFLARASGIAPEELAARCGVEAGSGAVERADAVRQVLAVLGEEDGAGCATGGGEGGGAEGGAEGEDGAGGGCAAVPGGGGGAALAGLLAAGLLARRRCRCNARCAE